ncbi:dimethylaniline monooxygenase [Phellopilus nigrolimitatus]|nr:dimethylaniline monooxygenase [Phellopilus nigrolimitatus]
MSSEVNVNLIATNWLSALAAAVSAEDLDALSSLFVSDGYLRDLLVFSWDLRTVQGCVEIKTFLADKITSRGLSNFKIDESSKHLVPVAEEVRPGANAVVAAFTFETKDAHGRGSVRLVQESTGKSNGMEWKALSVLMLVSDWKGHEEVLHESGIYGGMSWRENSYLLVVGAGHVGLQVAACLRQMGVACLVIEKDARIGDNWRNRYPSLKLHIPRAYCQLLYQPFPTTWPTYTPKDKLADWLENYAITQELFVWTSSTIENNPIYDETAKKWTVVVKKDGRRVTLRPPHLIMALSTFGDGVIPKITGQELFQGTLVHSSRFPGGAAYKGQRVLVIGAANSASDICVDLVDHGAKAVTMLQRSATCVVSSKFITSLVKNFFPEDVPIAVTDFKMDTTPNNLFLEMLRGMQLVVHEHDKEMRQELTEAGFKLSDGPTGAGYIELGLTKGGGTGEIRLKQGTEVISMGKNNIVFSDGSELETDAVVFATGFKPIRETYKRILGDAIVDKTPDVFGLDEEGEVKGVFRPTGQRGLWYAAGDFTFARRYVKLLALLIKANQIGLYQI